MKIDKRPQPRWWQHLKANLGRLVCTKQAKESSRARHHEYTRAREAMSHYWDFEGAESMDEHPDG